MPKAKAAKASKTKISAPSTEATAPEVPSANPDPAVAAQNPFLISDKHPAVAPYVATTDQPDGARNGESASRRTAIVLYVGDNVIYAVPLDASGLRVVKHDPKKFRKNHKVVYNYALHRAIQIYQTAAEDFGATEAASTALEQLRNNGAINVEYIDNLENEDMATKKGSKKAPAKKTAGKATEAKAKSTAAPKEPKEKKVSAASRFKELIMEGKKTDDEIFAVVKKEFGLDDSKRSYVAWYRNDLKKKGEKNVPDAIK